MELITHGAACCGIKTIYGFAGVVAGGPKAMAEELFEIDEITADWIYQAKRFFHKAAPKETQLKRLDRYLAYLDKKRPNGICEVVIAKYMKEGQECHDQMFWRPILEERGFREVSNCHNSNSGNRIYIFHRVRDKEEKKAV